MDPDILGEQAEDEEMAVSIELVTMIVTVASTLLGLAAGFGWMITRTDARFEGFEQRMGARFEKSEQRMDARFEKSEQRTDARFEGFEQRMDARFEKSEERVDARFERSDQRMDARFEKSEQRTDARFDRLESDIAEVKAGIGEVKIAIARLEGPAPRLLVAR